MADDEHNRNPGVHVRLDPALYERVEAKAERESRSKASVVRQWMIAGMPDNDLNYHK